MENGEGGGKRKEKKEGRPNRCLIYCAAFFFVDLVLIKLRTASKVPLVNQRDWK